MAYLYEYSAVWRALVHASRNPRILGGIVVVTTAGCALLARGTQHLTTPATDDATTRMNSQLKSDPEARRQARNGQSALTALFDSVGKTHQDNDKYRNTQMKLPQVEWHPAVYRRDRKPHTSGDKPTAIPETKL